MKTLKFTLIIALFLLTSNAAFSQGAAVNATGAAADPSAILDVSSNNFGILIPRMTEIQKNSIASPATGLMIYQTDGTTGFWYYDGSAWVQSIGIAGANGATGPTGNDGAASTVSGPTGAVGPTGPIGPTGTAASCPAANAGETLIEYNGCLYVKNVDEPGTYIWDNAKTQCTSYGSGWYLPNKDELNQLYLNWNQPSNGGDCQGGPCPLTGFSTSYWSSTVYNATHAMSQYFPEGGQGQSQANKTVSYNVRCVRR